MAQSLPKITVVTPSFNQAKFLERTILSVLNQDYPNLEYIIIDGGSTDGSVEIIKKYSDKLTYWVSEHDCGQTHAINKGLQRATGEWVAWQNSDDIYYLNAFSDLADAIAKYPKAGLIAGNLMIIDKDDQPLRDVRYVKPSYMGLLAEGMVLVNQATFWRRSLHRDIGFLNENLHYNFDYEWFLRLLKKTPGEHINKQWGGFRLHDAAKTNLNKQGFIDEKKLILKGRNLSAWKKQLYRLRRLLLMLAQGDVRYVMRGLLRHIRGHGQDMY